MARSYDEILVEVRLILALTPRVQLSALSKRTHIDRHLIERAVHELTGCSFRDYRQKEVAVQAVKLVAETNALMKQIATGMGYRSHSAFCRMVKRATGITPRQIRRKAQAST